MLDATQKPSRSRIPWLNIFAIAAVVVAGSLITVKNLHGDTSNTILNVSYDPTRELYAALDPQFIAEYKKQTGVNWRSSSRTAARRGRRATSSTGRRRPTLSRWRCRPMSMHSQARPDRAGLAVAPAQQFGAPYFNDRLRRPQGQSEEHSRLAGPHQGRCRHRDAEPAHLRQRQIKRSRGLGLRHDARRQRCSGARWFPAEQVFAEEDKEYSATIKAVRYAHLKLQGSRRPGRRSCAPG